jgi:putative flippase GtrA
VIRASDLRQFLLFASIGAVGTACHFALLFVLVTLRIAGPVAGSMAGFCLGACVNYALNRRFTFRSSRSHSSALPRFMTVAVIGAALNLGIMYLLTHIARVHYLPAQAIATGAVLACNYLGSKLWAFEQA